jgi:hypothetical protein
VEGQPQAGSAQASHCDECAARAVILSFESARMDAGRCDAHGLCSMRLSGASAVRARAASRPVPT